MHLYAEIYSTLDFYINERYLNDFSEASNIKVVETVSSEDGMTGKMNMTYEYSGGKEFFDHYRGTGIYSLVSSWVGEKTKNGKSTTEFCIDSSTGAFGQVFAVTNHNSKMISYVQDDTIRISGWLMDLDGYTPKNGVVGISLDGAIPDRFVVPDAYTGYFQIKRHNPNHESFYLKYGASTNSSGLRTVFGLIHNVTSWEIDYPGREGDRESVVYDSRYFWENVKINFGSENGKDKTVWNMSRRPNSLNSTYNFAGTKQIRIGQFHTAVLPRPVRTITTSQGVNSISVTPYDYYDDHNNLPVLSYVNNSGNSIRATQTIFAHDAYAAMGAAGAYMLTQPAGSISYSTALQPRVSWVSSTNSTHVDPPGTADHPLQILTSAITGDLKPGDKIVVEVPHQVYGSSFRDSRVIFNLLINGTLRTSCESWSVSGDRSVIQLEYRILASDMPVTSVAVGISDVDITLDVRTINAYIYKNIELPESNVVSASAVTWNNQSGIWRADTSYVWKVDMTETGLPRVALDDFSYVNPASNLEHNWKVKASIERYSKSGQPVQVNTAGGQAQTSVTGTVLKSNVASIANADFKESGVFTGDYDLNETGGNGSVYFDIENGWEKGAGNESGLGGAESKVALAAKHFGENGVRVHNAFGPTRTSSERIVIMFYLHG